MATKAAMAAALDRDTAGGSIIPASQRPDGTWRKPRRVKDGYVPQEEVPLYESKGKQFAARRDNGIPVGLTAEIVAEAKARREAKEKSEKARCPVSGLILQPNDGKKKKKKSGSDEINDSMYNLSINQSAKKPQQPADPVKRIKNLKKKLREIDVLEAKLSNGEIENPEKEQLDKVKNREQVISEIARLEALI